jgi:hypothetical protein
MPEVMDTQPRISPKAPNAWFDALAFLFGVGVAWRMGWRTTDLVWSLWLSSLVVGFAAIAWAIFRPILWFEQQVAAGASSAAARAGFAAAGFFGGLLALGFFTFHFGMFHAVHSMFLSMLFPLDGMRSRGPSWALLRQVFSRYWIFLPATFLAERAAFSAVRTPGRSNITDAYKNVIRMHFLIFFFVFAHFVRLENAGIFLVVYAVYFFPWSLLAKRAPEPAPTS